MPGGTGVGGTPLPIELDVVDVEHRLRAARRILPVKIGDRRGTAQRSQRHIDLSPRTSGRRDRINVVGIAIGDHAQ